MAVSLGHSYICVSDDFSDDVQIDPGIDHMGDEGVAQVVEVEISDAGATACIFEGCAHVMIRLPVLPGEEKIGVRMRWDFR